VAINGSRLSVTSDGNLGSASNILRLNGGTLAVGGTGTLNLSARNTTLGTAGGTYDVATGLTANYGGVISGTSFTKAGGGTLNLTGTSTLSGATLVSGGVLALSGAGGTLGDSAPSTTNRTAAIGIVNGGELRLDNTAANNDLRLGNTSTPAGITIGTGGKLTLLGHSGGTSQSIGVLSADVGAAGVVTVTAGGETATLTAAALGRNHNGTLFFQGTNLGTAASEVGRVVFGTTPTLVGGSGAPNQLNISIIPFVVGVDSTSSGTPLSLVTYGTTGIRPLSINQPEYATYAGSINSTDNVRIDGAGSGLLGKTINALVVHSTNTPS
jgi:autotransporter-associated beta strand protein